MEKRFVKYESDLMKRSMAFLGHLLDVQDDMQSRLGMIENGPERWNELTNRTTELVTDMLSTCPPSQRTRLVNGIRDYKIELLPIHTPMDTKVMLPREQVKKLVDLAKYRCQSCTDSEKEAEKCPLYQWLIAEVPTDIQGNGLLCPYNLADWVD